MLIHVAGLSWVGEELEGTAAWALGGALTYGSRWAVIVFVMATAPCCSPRPRTRTRTVLPPLAREGGYPAAPLARGLIPLLVWHAA